MSRFNKERMSIRSTVLQNQYAFFLQWQCHEQPVMSCNCLGRWGFSGGQRGGLGREGMPPIKHKFELTHYNILINSQKFKICSKLNFLFLIKNYKYLSFKKMCVKYFYFTLQNYCNFAMHARLYINSDANRSAGWLKTILIFSILYMV